MNPTTKILALAMTLGFLSPSIDAQGGPGWNRRVTEIAFLTDTGPTVTVAAVLNFDRLDGSTADLDLGATVELYLNSVLIDQTTLAFVAMNSSSGNGCFAGPCKGTCGFSIYGLMGCSTDIATGTACNCSGSTLALFPINQSPLQPGDEIMVLLRPAPGALPEPIQADDLKVASFSASSMHWNRAIGDVTVTPSPGAPDSFFDIVTDIEFSSQGIGNAMELSTDVELYKNGVLLQTAELLIVFDPATGGGPSTQASFNLIPADPDDDIVVILKPKPGALPELPGFDEDDEQQVEVPTLFVDVEQIPVHSGGTQNFSLEGQAGLAGEFYLLVGSLSGTAPGIPVDGYVLPLNFDGWLLFTMSNPNTPPYSNTVGFLDPAGSASAAFDLPVGMPPSIIGLVFHHAYATFDIPGTGVVTHTSNPVVLELVL